MRLPPFHLHPSVELVFITALVWYLVAVRRHERAIAPGEEPQSRRKTALFVLGVVTLWVGADWPIHDLAERYLFSIHMFQHLLFSLVAPPLLIAGTPVWMLRRILAPRPVNVVWRFLTRPVVALIVFNGFLFFTHWPPVVEAAVRSEPEHFVLHLLLVGSALVMWWPVMSPLPEMPSLPLPGQMLYLFFQSLAPTIPASFLTFGSKPLYPIYGTFPRIWGVPVMTDQLLAGLEMKLLGGAILWGFIAVIFFRWYAREHDEGWDALSMVKVEGDVRAGISKKP